MRIRLDNAGSNPTDAAARDRFAAMRAAADKFKKSGGEDTSAIEALQARTPPLTPTQEKELESMMTEPDIVQAVHGFKEEDIQKVFEAATPEEKTDLLTYRQHAFETLIGKHQQAAADAEEEGDTDRAAHEQKEADKIIDQFNQLQ